MYIAYGRKLVDKDQLKNRIEKYKKDLSKTKKKMVYSTNSLIDLTDRINKNNMDAQLKAKENMFCLLNFAMKKQPSLFQCLRQFLKRLYLEQKDLNTNNTDTEAQVRNSVPFFANILSENKFMLEKFYQYMIELICNPIYSNSISGSRDKNRSNFDSDEIIGRFDSLSDKLNNIMSDESKQKEMIKFIDSEGSNESKNKRKSQPSIQKTDNKKNRSESKNV